MSGLLDQLRQLQDRNIKKLDKIPDWPGIELYIKTLSAEDVFNYQKAREDKNKNWRPYLVMLAVCDEAGNSEFKEKDLDFLSSKSVRAIDYIIEQINNQILMTDDELEDKVKNS